MSSSSYLPPGWTEARLKAATVDDLREIPEDKIHLLDANIIKDIFAMGIVRKAQVFEAQHLKRESLGLPPAPRKPLFEKPVDPVVQVVEEAGGADFGFCIFRADDYSSQERWEKWTEECNKIMDASLAKASGGERIKDKLLISLVDNKELKDASLPQINDAFHFYREKGDVPPGLDIGMCLAVENDAMDSLLNPVPGQEPWVYAIDTSFDFEHSQDIPVGEYPGFFPVAISSLVPELYPMLAGPQMDPRELWPFAKPIWKSAFEL